MYKYKDAKNRQIAKAVAKRILDEARSKAAKMHDSPEPDLKPGTALGVELLSHLRAENVLGVHIYSAAPDMWYADFELRTQKPGQNVIAGTPYQAPLASKQAAENWAVQTIALLIRAERHVAAQSPSFGDGTVFELDRVSFVIAPNLIALAKSCGAWTEHQAAFLIDRLRDAMGGTATVEGIARMTRDEKIALEMAMASLLIVGVPRYPKRKPSLH